MPAMQPTSLQHTLTHPLARMLPMLREQQQVYRLGEKHPPVDDLPTDGPVWEACTFNIGPLTNSQARINLQRAFTLIALSASSSSNAAGGFRLQFLDTKKSLRFFDRPLNFANVAGGGNVAPPKPPGYVFLREPWTFDQPDSQILVSVTNFETVQNVIQVVFYGHVLRFNAPDPRYQQFPGGPVFNLVDGGQ